MWSKSPHISRSLGTAFLPPSASVTLVPECCDNIVDRPGKSGILPGNGRERTTQNEREKTSWNSLGGE